MTDKRRKDIERQAKKKYIQISSITTAKEQFYFNFQPFLWLFKNLIALSTHTAKDTIPSFTEVITF